VLPDFHPINNGKNKIHKYPEADGGIQMHNSWVSELLDHLKHQLKRIKSNIGLIKIH